MSSGEWKVKARNALTRRWTIFASGSQEQMERVLFVQGRAMSFPFDQMRLIPPRVKIARNDRSETLDV